MSKSHELSDFMWAIADYPCRFKPACPLAEVDMALKWTGGKILRSLREVTA